jgi:hypothetical protein
MSKTLALVIALAVSATAAQAAEKCRDAKGKFMKCPPAAAAAPASGYKLDAKGNCHDPKGKMAKKAMCAATAK